MQFTVQLASDLHLEWPGAFDRFSRQPPEEDAAAAPSPAETASQGIEDVSDCFKVVPYVPEFTDHVPVLSDYLLLGGDIGNPFKDHYREYLTTLSHDYRHVFVVSGNHEYYTNEYYSTNEKIEEVCSLFPNVHFLNRKMVCVDDRLVVVGCTLWSHIPNPEEAGGLLRAAKFGDYLKIQIRRVRGDIVGQGRIRPRDTNALHAGDVAFLRESLMQIRSDPDLANRKVIVLTHHAPLDRGVSSPKHEATGGLVNRAFATDLRDLIVEFGDVIDVWAHVPVTLEGSEELKEVVVTSNQLGYFMDDEKCGFDPQFTIPLSVLEED